MYKKTQIPSSWAAVWTKEAAPGSTRLCFCYQCCFLTYFVWIHTVPEDFISQGLESLL